VVRAARVAKQRCGRRIFAVVNQQATIEEAAYYVKAAPRLYNGDLRQRRDIIASGEDVAQGKSPVCVCNNEL
jgi:hypothetical protein